MLMQILSQSLRFSIFSVLSTPYFHLWDEKKGSKRYCLNQVQT